MYTLLAKQLFRPTRLPVNRYIHQRLLSHFCLSFICILLLSHKFIQFLLSFLTCLGLRFQMDPLNSCRSSSPPPRHMFRLPMRICEFNEFNDGLWMSTQPLWIRPSITRKLRSFYPTTGSGSGFRYMNSMDSWDSYRKALEVPSYMPFTDDVHFGSRVEISLVICKRSRINYIQ